MKSKKQKLATALILLLLLLPALYLVIQLSVILDKPYKTETAIRYDMSDSLFLNGFLSFEQQEIPGDGMLGYLVKNGERVSAGSQIAEQYENEVQAHARREITELDAQLQLLKKSENTSFDDISVLLHQRQSDYYTLLENLDQKNYRASDSAANNYLLSLNQLQITTGAIESFDAARSGIERQREEAIARLGSPNAITAPSGGYFVAASAGNWLEYDAEQLSSMPADAIQDAFVNDTGIRPINGAGKIVSSYKWKFYGICTVDESKKFENVKKVDLCFPGSAEKILPAAVESVEVDEISGLAKIVLHCEYVGADLLALSSATAQINFNSYQGLRISSKALHIVDGEKGVYVKYGNMARWRKINILFQNDEYLLVPLNGKVGTENEVTLFDEIITEGTDLKDGKLLK